MIDIYPPDITLGGFDIRQHGNTILITLPNGNNPNTTEQKIVPTCKRYFGGVMKMFADGGVIATIWFVLLLLIAGVATALGLALAALWNEVRGKNESD